MSASSETPTRGVPVLSPDMTIRAKVTVWVSFAGAIAWATLTYAKMQQLVTDVAELKSDFKDFREGHLPIGHGPQAKKD